MIIVYEPWARDTLHFEFNLSNLKILSKIYSEDEIVYYGDHQQISLLKEKVKSKNIRYENVEIKDYSKNKMKIVLNESLNIYKILKKNPKKVFITNCLPHTLFLIKLLKKTETKVYGFFHGLEQLYSRKKGLYKFFPLSIKFKSNENFKYIVLGDSIKKNLLTLYPKLDKNLYSVDHPYSFDAKLSKKLEKNRDYIKVGTVGSGLKIKGTQNLFEIAKNFEKDSNIKFYHIGSLEKSIEEYGNVIVPSKEGPLPVEEFERYVSELDFILYFYPENSYRLTASGALLDAFKFSKPIIALKNDYFKYVSSKTKGIGYLVESVDEVKELLSDVHKLQKNYPEFQKNLYENRDLFSCQKIKEDLEDIINERN